MDNSLNFKSLDVFCKFCNDSLYNKNSPTFEAANISPFWWTMLYWILCMFSYYTCIYVMTSHFCCNFNIERYLLQPCSWSIMKIWENMNLYDWCCWALVTFTHSLVLSCFYSSLISIQLIRSINQLIVFFWINNWKRILMFLIQFIGKIIYLFAVLFYTVLWIRKEWIYSKLSMKRN